MARPITLDQQIKNVCKATHKTALDVHNVAVLCLVHANEHGDTSKAFALVTGISKATRPETLKAWFMKFSPITFEATKARITKGDKANAWDVEGAKAKPYYEAFEEQSAAKILDAASVDKLIGALIGKLEKTLNGENDNATVAPTDVDAITIRIGALKAMVRNGYRVDAPILAAGDRLDAEKAVANG